MQEHCFVSGRMHDRVPTEILKSTFCASIVRYRLVVLCPCLCVLQALALLEDGYSLDVSRIDVLGDDSDKKIKQMKTFSGRDTVPQVGYAVS